MSNLTIFCLTFNEHDMLPFMVEHYRARFPECRFVIWDNESTDDTREIAERAGAEVHIVRTSNIVDDSQLRDHKNGCWKQGGVEWACVVDCDELVDIDAQQLAHEEQAGTTVIRCVGYDMVSAADDQVLRAITNGAREPLYDKMVMFDARAITDINYWYGAHGADPRGAVRLSNRAYPLFHYKYLSVPSFLARAHLTNIRMSETNKRNGWGYHNGLPDEELIARFQTKRQQSVTVRDLPPTGRAVVCE